MSVFKRLYNPNGVLLTNDNCFFVCCLTGSDTNAGTRDLPFATITKAQASSNDLKLNICVNDAKYDENFVTTLKNTGPLIFADKNSIYIKSVSTLTSSGGVALSKVPKLYNFRIGSVTRPLTGNIGFFSRNCYIEYYNVRSGSGNAQELKYCFINHCYQATFSLVNPPGNCGNLTINIINQTENGLNLHDSIISEKIIINSGILTSTRLINSIIRKSVKYFIGDIEIPIAYGSDSDNWINDVKSSINTWAQENIPEKASIIESNINTFFGTKCLIVDDIAGVKIFNQYNSEGLPVDYTLNPDLKNLALTASSTNGIVGAYQAALPKKINISINVDDNGNDTEENGDLLIYDDNDGTLSANETSLQTWNRMRTDVIAPSRKFLFTGATGDLQTGINQGFYYGKKQSLDSNNIPVETLEIVPYNSETERSSFPMFSCSLRERTLMWYWVAGEKINQPVLFNDLIDLGIESDVDLNIYGNYAVTSADYANNSLIGNPNVVLRTINVSYCKIEVNLHQKI